MRARRRDRESDTNRRTLQPGGASQDASSIDRTYCGPDELHGYTETVRLHSKPACCVLTHGGGPGGGVLRDLTCTSWATCPPLARVRPRTVYALGALGVRFETFFSVRGVQGPALSSVK
eukprot:3030766-Prymnesium_polylepis.1